MKPGLILIALATSILLFGVVAPGLWFRDSLETALEKEAHQRLQNAGLQDVTVTADHLDISLTGSVPSETDRLLAESIVLESAPVRMSPGGNRLNVIIPPNKPSQLRLRYRSVGEVLIEGNVGSQETLDYLVTGMRKALGGGDVEAIKLIIDPQTFRAPWTDKLPAFVALLAQSADDWSLDVDENRCLISGRVASPTEKASLESETVKLFAPLEIQNRLEVIGSTDPTLFTP